MWCDDVGGATLRSWKTSYNSPCLYVSYIVTSAPSTACAVPLPRVARGRLGDNGILASPAEAGEVASAASR